MNKTDYIQGLLILSPHLNSKEIAERAECTPQMVNYVKRNKCRMKAQPKRGHRVGIIADTHCPAEHPGYFEFVKETFNRWSVDTVVHIGDAVDMHRASRHPSEPGSMNIMDELELTKKSIKRWTEAFPNVLWCMGNHDAIPYRQAKSLGMPKEFIKPLHELLEMPATWVLANQHVIDAVVYEHGVGSAGQYGMKNTALKYRMSFVQGHTHVGGGVLYSTGPRDTVFGLNVGTGCDASHISQTYACSYKSKQTLGCGIVLGGSEAYYVPMV